MQLMRVYIIISFLLSVFPNIQVSGQKYFEWDWPSATEDALWETMQVSYKLPTGFKFWLTEVNSDPMKHSIYYDSMNSPDRNFMILIEISEYLSPSRLSLAKILYPNFGNRDQDSLYLELVEEDMKKSLKDKYKSLDKSPIKHYSAKATKKKFNADHALTYPIILRKRFEGKEFCQAIVIQKNKRGAIKMLCYYNKMSRSQLKKYIKIAEEVFYFRDPEDFIPYPKGRGNEPITLPKIRKIY